MNKLVLMGQLFHVGGKKYVEYVTESGNAHRLPVISEVDFADGTWVRFSGKLCTKLVMQEGKSHKMWFGLGTLSNSDAVEGLYLNDFEVDGTVVRVYGMRTTTLTSRKIVDFIVADGDNYFNCVAFGKTAARVCDYLSTGKAISLVSARFCSRKYDKNGKSLVAYEVNVRDFV